MDDRQPKRSLADDPKFLASLDQLDRGLSGDDDDQFSPSIQSFPEPVAPEPAPLPRPMAPRGAARPTPAHIARRPVPAPISIAAPPPPLAAHSAPTPSAIGLPEPPPWLPPTAFAAINAASAALSVAFEGSPAPASAPPPSPAPVRHTGTPGSPRTLLDLFPPAVSRDATAPSLPLQESVTVAPPIAASAPPRIAVRPRVVAAAGQPRPAATYETFYGLDEKPFGASADLRFLYHSSAHDRVLQDLLSAVGKRDAVSLLTGAAGMGKTLLCRALVDQLDRRTLVSCVSTAVASREDLLRTLLVDFGVISREEVAAGGLASASRDDLSRALRDFLSSLAVLQATALLIVDDADTLPPVVLQEVRALSEIAGPGHQLQIVLVGAARLARQLRSGELRAVDDRVALRAELGPLEADEVPGYVAHRLAVAGRGERVAFSETALRKIFALSDGVPSVVNLICDRALTLGYKTSASQIDGDFVDEAAQQLGLTSRDGDSWRDRLLVVALMLALMLAGAGGAAWVFRAPLTRVWSQWHRASPR